VYYPCGHGSFYHSFDRNYFSGILFWRRNDWRPPASLGRWLSRKCAPKTGHTGNLDPQRLDDLARRHRLARIESQSIGLTGATFHRWRISDGRSVSDVICALEADSAVGAAQPNYRFALQQGEPRAPVEFSAMQYALTKLNLPEAHQFSKGNVLVAVIDSGIDTSHPKIADMVAGSFDAVNSRQPPDRTARQWPAPLSRMQTSKVWRPRLASWRFAPSRRPKAQA
jgi:hypothetical protein